MTSQGRTTLIKKHIEALLSLTEESMDTAIRSLYNDWRTFFPEDPEGMSAIVAVLTRVGQATGRKAFMSRFITKHLDVAHDLVSVSRE